MQAMQCTKCRFCCSSRQSKMSRWHCFNVYAFTFTFWYCIERLGTSTDRKTSESEIIHNFKDSYNAKIEASVWNTVWRNMTKSRSIQKGADGGELYLCVASLACDAHAWGLYRVRPPF